MLNSYDLTNIITNLTGNTASKSADNYNKVENALFNILLTMERTTYDADALNNEIALLLDKLEHATVIYDRELNKVVAVVNWEYGCYFKEGANAYPFNNDRFVYMQGSELAYIDTINELTQEV